MYSTVCKGLWLSWLERTPDKREVDGSSPFNPTKLNKTVERYTDYFYKSNFVDILKWGYSSVGRAPALQAGGQGFKSLYLHCGK